MMENNGKNIAAETDRELTQEELEQTAGGFESIKEMFARIIDVTLKCPHCGHTYKKNAAELGTVSILG